MKNEFIKKEGKYFKQLYKFEERIIIFELLAKI